MSGVEGAKAPQPFTARRFLADLLAADMTVAAHPSGKLELFTNGEEPRHADADAMRSRFYALTASERADLSAYIRALTK